MTNIPHSSARRWLAVAAFLATPAAFAHGSAPSGLERDTTEACASPRQAGADAAPGPYAKYLMLNGMSRESALEAARTVDASSRRLAEAMSRPGPDERGHPAK